MRIDGSTAGAGSSTKLSVLTVAKSAKSHSSQIQIAPSTAKIVTASTDPQEDDSDFLWQAPPRVLGYLKKRKVDTP